MIETIPGWGPKGHTLALAPDPTPEECRDIRVQAREGSVVIVHTKPPLRGLADIITRVRGNDAAVPGRVFFAPRIERQSEIDFDLLLAFVRVTASRALVVTPKEFIRLPAYFCRYCGSTDVGALDDKTRPPPHGARQGRCRRCLVPLADKVADLVVVVGPTGPAGWPLHPGWVRSIRDDCVTHDVAFMFVRWGEWWPVTSPRLLPQRVTERMLVHLDGHMREPTPADSASEVRSPWAFMAQVGAQAAGRRLDGLEYLELPKGFR